MIITRLKKLMFSADPNLKKKKYLAKSLNSQKWWWPKPRWNRLNGFPFLLINKAEKIIFSASSLVLPEDTILTTRKHMKTQVMLLLAIFYIHTKTLYHPPSAAVSVTVTNKVVLNVHYFWMLAKPYLFLLTSGSSPLCFVPFQVIQ